MNTEPEHERTVSTGAHESECASDSCTDKGRVYRVSRMACMLLDRPMMRIHRRLGAVALGVAAWSIAGIASADICPDIEASAENVVVTITPQTLCITAEVLPIGCGDSLQIQINNGCSVPMDLDAEHTFRCVGTECTSIPAGESATVFPEAPEYEAGPVEEIYHVVVDSREIEIQINYDAVYTSMSSDQEGCSVSAPSTGASPMTSAAGIFGLLGVAGLLSRRRRFPPEPSR